MLVDPGLWQIVDRQPPVSLKDRQDLYLAFPQPTDDPVVSLDQLAQPATGQLRERPPEAWLMRQDIGTVD